MVGARPALKPPVDMAKRPELDRKKLVEAPQNHRKEAVSEKKNILHTGGKPGSSWCQICVDFVGWCVFFWEGEVLFMVLLSLTLTLPCW